MTFDDTTGAGSRRSLGQMLTLATALLALALAAVAFVVAARDDDPRSVAMTMPATMSEHFEAMTEHMGDGVGTMPMMGMAADPKAMRDRCVTMMGGVRGIEDPATFCDDMVELMTQGMTTRNGMMMPMMGR